MQYLLIAGLLMVGLNILFTYLELVPWLRAIKEKKERSAQNWTLPIVLFFTAIYHWQKLIPSIADIGIMIGLTTWVSFGSGFQGGIAALFGSNLISTLIYFNTHRAGQRKFEFVV